MTPEAGAVAAVALLLVDARGRILSQLRDAQGTYPDHWATVGGAVEGGETLEEAARRELFEETGYRLTGPLTLGCSAVFALSNGGQRHVTVFVAPYDGLQPVSCYEGREDAFVGVLDLDKLRATRPEGPHSGGSGPNYRRRDT